MSERKILNVREGGGGGGGESLESIGIKLQRNMLEIKGLYLASDGKGVDYDKIKDSPEFSNYTQLACSLTQTDLKIASEEERKSFFINIYNVLTIHGLVLSENLPSSVLELNSFWRTTCYNIGGFVFSLDDIEHGILRCNRPHPSGDVMFTQDDARLQFIMTKFDPRIHFALVCGAKSCPAIQVYSADKLERALNGATKNFCSQEVTVDVPNRKVILSKIFLWYFKDFGSSNAEVVQWISQYLEDDKGLQSLLVDINNINIEYKEYDWLINKL